MPSPPRDPRVLYVSLLASLLLGTAAGWTIEHFAPTTELAAEHAAATTPLARAVTSPAAEMVLAITTCVLFAWGLTLLVFWYRWRIPGDGWILGRSHPHVRTAFSISILMFIGLNSLATSHRLVGQGWFSWTVHGIGVLIGAFGVLCFALFFFASFHPRMRTRM